MKLYKYRPVNMHTKAIFTDLDFWASSPESLNDPFDLDPFFDTEITKAGFEEHIDGVVRDLHPDLSQSQRQDIVTRRVVAEWPISERDREQYAEVYRERIRRTGVICFSERWDSILMWSHYADNHKGICVEIDTDVLLDGWLINVRYTRERPRVNLFTDHKTANETTGFAKNDEWSYEREWRVVLENPAGQEGAVPGLVTFPPGSVTGVILGSRSPDDDRSDVVSWSQGLTPQPRIYEAFKDDREYRIGRRPLF